MTEEHENRPRRSLFGRALRIDPIAPVQHLTEETAQKLIHALEQSQPVRRLRASQLLSGLLGAVGFALFIFGVERVSEDLPVISNPYGATLIGILLLAATGLLLRRLSG